MIDDELLYLWYGMMNRMVHTQKIELAFRFGGIRGLWETSEKVLQESLTKKQFETVMENRTEHAVLEYRNRLEAGHITYVYPGHDCYPGKLYDIPDPPMLLFAAGDINVLKDMAPLRYIS